MLFGAVAGDVVADVADDGDDVAINCHCFLFLHPLGFLDHSLVSGPLDGRPRMSVARPPAPPGGAPSGKYMHDHRKSVVCPPFYPIELSRHMAGKTRGSVLRAVAHRPVCCCEQDGWQVQEGACATQLFPQFVPPSGDPIM